MNSQSAFSEDNPCNANPIAWDACWETVLAPLHYRLPGNDYWGIRKESYRYYEQLNQAAPLLSGNRAFEVAVERYEAYLRFRTKEPTNEIGLQPVRQTLENSLSVLRVIALFRTDTAQAERDQVTANQRIDKTKKATLDLGKEILAQLQIYFRALSSDSVDIAYILTLNIVRSQIATNVAGLAAGKDEFNCLVATLAKLKDKKEELAKLDEGHPPKIQVTEEEISQLEREFDAAYQSLNNAESPQGLNGIVTAHFRHQTQVSLEASTAEKATIYDTSLSALKDLGVSEEEVVDLLQL